jgi:hypothetical protein
VGSTSSPLGNDGVSFSVAWAVPCVRLLRTRTRTAIHTPIHTHTPIHRHEVERLDRQLRLFSDTLEEWLDCQRQVRMCGGVQCRDDKWRSCVPMGRA